MSQCKKCGESFWLRDNCDPTDFCDLCAQGICIDLEKLVKKWRRKSVEFGKKVQPEWEDGDKYASRRYEGEGIALRWCAEDLEKLLKP